MNWDITAFTRSPLQDSEVDAEPYAAVRLHDPWGQSQVSFLFQQPDVKEKKAE